MTDQSEFHEKELVVRVAVDAFVKTATDEDNRLFAAESLREILEEAVEVLEP